MTIKVSAESLQSFKRNAGVQGIMQKDISRKEVAPIDEKNVCSDWVSDVFDECTTVHTEKRGKNTFVGFVSDCVCICSYSFGNNTLKWQIIADRKEDTESAIKTLSNRLQEYDKENETLQTEYTTEGNTLYQSFYFVEG